MLDKKYERYWDELDIDEEWLILLNSEHEDYKKSTDTYYRYTRSLDNMTDELMYKLIADKFMRDKNDDDFLGGNREIIKGISVNKVKLGFNSLTDRQQLILKKYVYERKTQEQIAEIMDCSQKNISDIISRAFAKIAKYLSK